MHLSTPLADMELVNRRDARTFSRAMLLKGGPLSAEGASLVAGIVDNVISPYQSAKGQLRPSTVAKFHAITGAFLADLLHAANAGRWSKRETNTNALTGLPGGATAFRTMRAAMGSAGLLEELPGYKKAPQELFGKEYTQAARTSFRPTAKLLAMVEGHGVSLSSLHHHFGHGVLAAPAPAEVLEARAEKQFKGQAPRHLEVRMSDPNAATIIEAMQRLNAHLMADGRVEGITFAGLRRVFLNADRPDFAWQWHGRFYSMPDADTYELMEGGVAARMRAIRIDGSEVAAVDISASHLTILHGLLGVPFDDSRDPYAVNGANRQHVKQWLLYALGSEDPATGGPKFNKLRAAMLVRYPFLAELPRLGIGPLALQFHEAEVMRLAMEDLMGRGIGFLPVHDELLVARGNEEIAATAIRLAFQRYFTDHLGLKNAPVPRLKWDNQGKGDSQAIMEAKAA